MNYYVQHNVAVGYMQDIFGVYMLGLVVIRSIGLISTEFSRSKSEWFIFIKEHATYQRNIWGYNI